MKAKLISVTVVFAVVIISISACFYISNITENTDDIYSEQIVALNEIQKLINSGQYELAEEKAENLQENIRNTSYNTKGNSQIIIICSISFVFILTVLGTFILLCFVLLTS